MNKKAYFISFLLMIVASMLPISSISAQSTSLTEAEAEAIGIEAYIYGYPLITMDLTRKVMTNVETPEGPRAPMGQFANSRVYPNASFKDVTAPNADTLYSTAWLNLSKEPYILHVPDENGRYYLVPMLSGWTNVFDVIGTRTTGTNAADYAITGPDWKGSLPNGVKEIKSPTNLVWILGRTYCSGTPEDYKAVHAIQDQYSLTPLSSFGKPYTPPKGIVDTNINMKTAVRDQVNQLTIETYFSNLARLMKENPPAPADAAMLTKFAKIGLLPGQEFDWNKLDAKVIKGLQNVQKKSLEKIMAYKNSSGKLINGWLISLKTGNYGTDYLQRALIAAIGLGANLPQDAVYPTAEVDSNGDIFNGKNRYVLHFPKGQTPPAKGFWSLTMYNDQFFFVANPLNRFSISPRNDLKYNADGSLDIYIQTDSPGKDKESNWLPAPPSQFILMLRLYWPEESLLNGSWTPPAVQKVK